MKLKLRDRRRLWMMRSHLVFGRFLHSSVRLERHHQLLHLLH